MADAPTRLRIRELRARAATLRITSEAQMREADELEALARELEVGTTEARPRRRAAPVVDAGAVSELDRQRAAAALRRAGYA